jgi:hypothetical protein
MTASLQRLSGSFPSAAAGESVAFFDEIVNSFGWSSGGRLIVPLSAQPTITSPWTILGWSITFSMWLYQGTIGPVNGLLGKLYGGLLEGSVAPQVGPFLASSLPSDPTSVQMLWDGSSDTTPPWAPGFIGGGPLVDGAQNVNTVSQQLPVPLAMSASDRLGMGLWLTPSLGDPHVAGSIGLAVRASYAIEYTTGS